MTNPVPSRLRDTRFSSRLRDVEKVFALARLDERQEGSLYRSRPRNRGCRGGNPWVASQVSRSDRQVDFASPAQLARNLQAPRPTPPPGPPPGVTGSLDRGAGFGFQIGQTFGTSLTLLGVHSTSRSPTVSQWLQDLRVLVETLVQLD